MAGNAVIGALRVVLGADTAAWDDGLKHAQSGLARFARDVSAVAGGVSLERAISNIVYSLRNLATAAINQADEMGKMAQRVGIPVEELSRLRLAAELSGVSMETLGTSVGRLSRNMSQVAGGTTNDASRAFQALGISVKNADGTLKSSQAVMEEVAERFKGMHDGAGKTALAMAIFGRAGAAMIPMLNQGAAGLREAAREAEELGLVIDQKTARAAESFNDNLRRLRLVIDGVALRVTAELAPALALLTGQFVQAAKDGDVVRNTANAIMAAIGRVAFEIEATTIFIRRLGIELAALGEVFVAFKDDVAVHATGGMELFGARVEGTVARITRLKDALIALMASTNEAGITTGKLGEVAEGSFSRTAAAWRRLQMAGEESNRQMSLAGTIFHDFREQADMLARHFENTANAVTRIAAPVIAAENALDKFFKTQAKTIAASQAEAATVGMVAGAREALRLVMQAEAVAQENNIRMTDKLRERMAFLAGEARFAALQTAGFQLVLENRTPLEQYQLALQNTEAAMRSVGATAEQIARAQEKAAERFGLSWSAIGTNIAGTAGALSQLSGTFAKENKAMGLASKAFGIAQAIINTQIAITKALATLPPPASYVAVALAVAQGAAAVASISAQKFSTGGMMRMALPPGSGADSQLLTARVRPDEQVDIWRPGEGPDQRRGAGGGGFTVVQMQLPGGAAGRFIEELISDINGKIADGYRLNASAA